MWHRRLFLTRGVLLSLPRAGLETIHGPCGHGLLRSPARGQEFALRGKDVGSLLVGAARGCIADSASLPDSRPEDRLTEFFATTLAVSHELCDRLFAHAGLERCAQYVVTTQPMLAGRKPDMRVVGHGAAGAPQATLWFEHKLRSTFSHRQREDYAEATAVLPGDHRLTVIVYDITELGAPEGWSELTWQQVAEFAAEAAESALGPAWRDIALGPAVAAKWRVVAELMWFLEHKEQIAMTAPLTARHVEALALAEEAVLALDQLMERALQLASESGVVPQDPKALASGVGVLHLRLPTPSWLDGFGDDCHVELVCEVAQQWTTRHTGLAYAAGFALPERFHPALSAARDWVDAVAEADFTVSVWECYCVIYRTMPLVELAARAETLHGQAERLAGWLASAVTDLAAIVPPVDPMSVPAKSPRRARPPR